MHMNCSIDYSNNVLNAKKVEKKKGSVLAPETLNFSDFPISFDAVL